MIVHIEGGIPFAVAVESERLTVLRNQEAAELGLKRYNDIYGTSYDLAKCQVMRLFEDDDTAVCGRREYVTLGSTYELIVILPGAAPTVVNRQQPVIVGEIDDDIPEDDGLISILQNGRRHREIPRRIRRNPVILDELHDLIDEMGGGVSARIAIGELLIREGLVEEGLDIGYSPFVIKNRPSETHVRKIWVLFMNYRISSVYMNIGKYLLSRIDDKIGDVCIDNFVRTLRGIQKATMVKTPRKFGSISPVLERSELPTFRVLCMLAIVAFSQGFASEYEEMRIAVPINVDTYFSAFPSDFDPEREAPEWTLYQRTGRTKLTGNSFGCARENMTFLIGDEFCVDWAFQGMGGFHDSMFHAIPGLSLWKIRKGNNCMESTAFWNALAAGQAFGCVGMFLGTVDLIEEAPMLVQQGKFATMTDAIAFLLETYRQIILEIKTRFPEAKICVKNVDVIDPTLRQMIDGFNEELMQVMQPVLPGGP